MGLICLVALALTVRATGVENVKDHGAKVGGTWWQTGLAEVAIDHGCCAKREARSLVSSRDKAAGDAGCPANEPVNPPPRLNRASPARCSARVYATTVTMATRATACPTTPRQSGQRRRR